MVIRHAFFALHSIVYTLPLDFIGVYDMIILE